jgi:two-component system phosphate regulon sensor histidine kinase PhoR
MEAQRMICLVEDIIRLSHLDEGATDMKREDVDLYAVAKDTMQILSTEAEEKHIQMNLEGYRYRDPTGTSGADF